MPLPNGRNQRVASIECVRALIGAAPHWIAAASTTPIRRSRCCSAPATSGRQTTLGVRRAPPLRSLLEGRGRCIGSGATQWLCKYLYKLDAQVTPQPLCFELFTRSLSRQVGVKSRLEKRLPKSLAGAGHTQLVRV